MNNKKYFELEFEGLVPDSVKKEIDYLVDKGFDPVRLKQEQEREKLQQQKEASLLLPESCMPKFGEMAVAPGKEATVSEVENYLEKLIFDLPPSSTFMLDFRERTHLVAAELVLTRLKAHMEGNYIRYVISPSMKEAVLRAQDESIRFRAQKGI